MKYRTPPRNRPGHRPPPSSRTKVRVKIGDKVETGYVLNATQLRPTKRLHTDPTGTVRMRAAMHRQLELRFKAVANAVTKQVVEDDAFGHTAGGMTPKPMVWHGLDGEQKVAAFTAWLKGLLGTHIKGGGDASYWNSYISAGFDVGAGGSYTDVVAMTPDVAAVEGMKSLVVHAAREQTSTEAGLTANALPLPVPKSQLKVILQQSFTELEGVTDDMAKKMARLVSQAIIKNTPPKELAGQLVKQVDISKGRAQTIARTELIKAHAEGQLAALEQMGVGEVEPMVEWATADRGMNKIPKGGRKSKLGNLSPCPLCAPMRGVVVPISQAKGMIPRHPNCVCAWLPAGLGESSKGQKTGAKAQKAIDKSVELGGGWGPVTNLLIGGVGLSLLDQHLNPHDLTDNRTYVRDDKGRFATTGSSGVKASASTGTYGSVEGLPHPSHISFVKSLGGSTGAQLVTDSLGKQWVMKKNPDNVGHLKSEGLADDLYRKLGVDVPKSGIVTQGGEKFKFSEFHEGQTLAQWSKGKSSDERQAMFKEIGKHFVADALLGNWDVAGLKHDNILITPDGKPLRIDNGGALEYRAQGGKKGSAWNGNVDELKTLRDPVKNPSASVVFQHLTDADINSQIKDVLAKKSAVLDEIKDQKLKAVMNARFTSLEEHLALSKPSQTPATTGGTDPIPVLPKKPPEPQTTPQPVSSVTGGDKLHTAAGLVEHIQKTAAAHGVKYTSQVLEKMHLVNPDGTKGVVKIPANAHSPAQLAHLKAVLPPGTVVQIAMLPSMEKLKQQYGANPPKIPTSTPVQATSQSPAPAPTPTLAPPPAAAPTKPKSGKSISTKEPGTSEHLAEISSKVADALVQMHLKNQSVSGVTNLKAWVKEAAYNGVDFRTLESSVSLAIFAHPELVGKSTDVIPLMKSDLGEMYNAVKNKAPGAFTPFIGSKAKAKISAPPSGGSSATPQITGGTGKHAGIPITPHEGVNHWQPSWAPSEWKTQHPELLLAKESGYTSKDPIIKALQDHFDQEMGKLKAGERQAISKYTGHAYADFNEAMMSCPPHYDCLSPSDKKFHEALKSGLTKVAPLPAPTVTARGISLSGKALEGFVDTMIELKETGGTYKMPGYASSSPTRPWKRNVQMTILAKTGLYVDSISKNKGEQEILLGPHQSYRVKDVLKTKESSLSGNSSWHVILEEI